MKGQNIRKRPTWPSQTGRFRRLRQRNAEYLSEGEAQTDASSQIIVLRSIDKIVTGVGEHTDMRREPVFKADADVAEELIVRTAAIQTILVSRGGDPSQRIVFVKDAANPAKRVRRQMKAWKCVIQRIT